MEGVEVTRSGRLFQTRAAATGKAWFLVSVCAMNGVHKNLLKLSSSNADQLMLAIQSVASLNVSQFIIIIIL